MHDFRAFMWLMPLAFALHEAEEWNILAWHRRRWDNPPPVTEITVHTWLVGIALFAFAWTLLGWAPGSPSAAAWIVLPFFLLTVLANALQHLALFAVDRAYNPGLLSAALLVLPSCVASALLALRQGLVPLWWVALFTLAGLPQVLAVVRAGRQMPPALLGIYRMSAVLSRALFGRV